MVYSDDEQLLSEYLESNKLVLKINESDIERLKSADLSKQKMLESDNIDDFDLTQEPKIIVELVTTNLQDDVFSYSLEVNSVETKSTEEWILGYPVGYTTSNNFIGAVHLGWGNKFIAKFRYKLKWYSSWEYLTVNGANSWWIYTTGAYYCSLDENYNLHKRGIVIYPHLYENGINYHISYSHDDHRGRNCEIGSYAPTIYGECYVGTAPSGTSAFIYAHKFYYTPINGNQCPRAGSYFDGANCFVMDIPIGCEPYTWQRNWLVKSNIL